MSGQDRPVTLLVEGIVGAVGISIVSAVELMKSITSFVR